MLRRIFFLIMIFINSVSFAEISFLTLSDMHYGANHTAESKHTGDVLWQTALQKYQQLSSKVDFILMLGDIPTYRLDAKEKSRVEAKIFHDLWAANTSKKPIFYIPGNNDSLGGNYEAFSENGISPLSNAKEWHGACAYCEGLVIDDTHMFTDGYYSSYVISDNKDIALITLNATQLVKLPWWLPNHYTKRHHDAVLQLQWLKQQLETIKAKQLLIAMHEEPGLDFNNNPVWQEAYLQEFINLLDKYKNRFQEISLLTAHSHYDELRKISFAKGASVFAYSTPAISRNHHNNSAMKVFSLSEEGYIKNFTTYYTAVSEAWKNDQYNAIGSEDTSIFSRCKGLTLAVCLNSLSDSDVCQAMESGIIYGVKNSQVVITNCLSSYPLQVFH